MGRCLPQININLYIGIKIENRVLVQPARVKKSESLLWTVEDARPYKNTKIPLRLTK